jgi:hypothetical protein
MVVVWMVLWNPTKKRSLLKLSLKITGSSEVPFLNITSKLPNRPIPKEEICFFPAHFNPAREYFTFFLNDEKYRRKTIS